MTIAPSAILRQVAQDRGMTDRLVALDATRRPDSSRPTVEQAMARLAGAAIDATGATIGTVYEYHVTQRRILEAACNVADNLDFLKTQGDAGRAYGMSAIINAYNQASRPKWPTLPVGADGLLITDAQLLYALGVVFPVEP